MPIPTDYAERVYAGVLGKIIGVYLGRPFEGWKYKRIMDELGEVSYYVHDKLGVPLIVTDDDISGTFTFLRALPDYGYSRDLTPAQIGQTWLNYIIERKTILWWGGLGNSTEHTAFLRLKQGLIAPESGSITRNGKVAAEQIGAQIFIDGWGMIAPGDPKIAAEFARRAASVSHDAEAIYGAQVVAAIEAQAFIEQDINILIDTAVALIPTDSVIYRMIRNIREWHAAEPDWRKTRERIEADYGYDKFGGNCHIVPNHALIILALLYGGGDFQKSLMIVNTSGWDTDCNSGNVGCLLGIRNGLQGIDDGPDWRGPVADRMYLPTADPGRCITDAAAEAYRIVNVGRALAGQPEVKPKEGARFHFELPGSLQGFRADDSIESRSVATVENAAGNSEWGKRSLAVRYHHLAAGRVARASTPTFIPPDALQMGGYGVIASPTLYAGQKVRAGLSSDKANSRTITFRLYVQVYTDNETLSRLYGPEREIKPGCGQELVWTVPDTAGYPIAEIGVELTSEKRADGAVYLDYLTWDGVPDTTLSRTKGNIWRRVWAEGLDRCEGGGGPQEDYRLGQDSGIGLLIQGCREWKDYQVSATVTPHLTKSCGIAGHVQGMKRYYALLLCEGNKARLVKALDGERVLAESDFPWQFGSAYALRLALTGSRLRGWINDQPCFDVQDTDCLLDCGAIALVCEEGRVGVREVRIQPAK